MRTTLTLDEDVARIPRKEMRKTGKSLKQLVNEGLRRGLVRENGVAPARAFVVQPRALGLKPGLSYDNIAELLEQLEGPLHR